MLRAAGAVQGRALHRHRYVPLLVLAVLPALWWLPLLSGHLPNFMDTVTHGYPLRMAVARQLREGVLPLWMPNVFSGTPLAANPQIAVWYPPHLLFYAAPGALSFGLLCVFHYVWGGWGAYLYVRRLTRSLPAGLFAALTLQFSAMLVSRIALLPHVYTTVWVPWMLLAVECAVRERGLLPRRGALMLAVLFAFQVLAGSPQISYYTGVLLPVYWLLRAGYTARWQWSQLPRRLAEALTQGAAAAGIALLLAGIQILPTLEFLQNSERSPIPLERLHGQALNDGFIWRSFVGFTGPTIEDTDSINAIGVGAMLLAVLALLFKRSRRAALPLWAMGICGFVLALGPLAQFWSTVLPMYSGFHAPRRALVFWTIGGSLAAGLGAGALHAFWRVRSWPPAGLYALLVLLTGGTWWMLPRLEREFVRPTHLHPLPAHVRSLSLDRFLVMDPTFAYTYDSRRPDYGTAMLPNLAALHETYDANGYDPLVLARYGAARREACAASGIIFPSHGVFLTNPNSALLEMLNVQYLVGRFDLYDPGRLISGTHIDHAQLSASLQLLHPHDRWPVYRYKQARPLAWTVAEVVSVQNANQALQTALRVGDVRRTAFVEGAASQGGYATTEVKATRQDARTFQIALGQTLSQPAFVCVASSWMPGWVARHDRGQVLETLPANGLITGIMVPAGVKQFTLRYEPTSFLRGALMTGMGFLFLLLAVVNSRRRRAERENK